MKIIKCDHYDDMSKKAAQVIISDMKEKKDIVLGLATGSTPIGLYKELIKANQEKQISFKDVMTFNLDEYIGISQKHPESYYQFMMRHLFNHVDIDQKNINLPNNDASSIDKHIKAYNDKMKKHPIDVQVLGIGANGHIGFNEPGTPFDNETFIVDLDEDTRIANQRFFDSLDEVPKKAITMGIKNIMRSKKIILLASGIHKAEAIKKMIEGPITTEHPASILQLHPNVEVFVDEEAGSMI